MSRHEPTGLPRGPRLPAALQGLQWIVRPIPFLEECNRRFGDTFTIRLFAHPPMVFTSRPDTVAAVFAGDSEELRSGEGNLILKPLLGRHSLLLLDGARHRGRRKLLMPPFHGQRMRAYAETMRRITDHHLDGWPVGRPFPILEPLQRLTLDIILSTVFGLDEGTRRNELRRHLVTLLGFTANPAVLFLVNSSGEVPFARLQRRLAAVSPVGRFLRTRESVGRVLLEEIRARRAEAAAREDVLSLLLAARDEDGRGLDDDELVDEMLTLLVAGHETTATALAWTCWRLLHHPEVHRAALAEVQEVAQGDVLPDEALSHLRFVEATIRETLRLHPIVPIVVRRLRSAARLGELELPAGAVVAPCAWLAQRRPDVWPEPEEFRPARFLERPVPPSQFFPFGGGARTCLGMAFALYEMKIVLARLLLRADLRLADGYAARTVRRGITFAPSQGVPIVIDALRPRDEPFTCPAEGVGERDGEVVAEV